MLNKKHSNSLYYNDIEKVGEYWNGAKRDNNIVPYKEKLIALSELFEQISSQNSVLILIWDMVKDRIVYAMDKKSVTGHKASLYLAHDGIRFTLSNTHPDFITAAMLMQLKAVEYVAQYKGRDYDKVIVNIDGRYKKSNSEYFHFLQQTVCIESDQNGYPLLFMAFIHDITYLKKEESANLIITTPGEIKLWNFNFDKQLLEAMKPLSLQEKKVLSYLRQGKHSKEIATELNVSTHTINTHRRNLLRKTNCTDTTGLITYAKLVGLF